MNDTPRQTLKLNCSTCGETGITVWADHVNDCPGIGEIQVSRHRGRGVVVDAAPARALIGLRIIRDLAWPANIAEVGDPDLVNIADQVLYRVTGYDPGAASLIVELVEDWRPEPTAPEPDDPSVGCWHTEPDTPCDWNVCRQPERLAAGDRGTDPARTTPPKERP